LFCSAVNGHGIFVTTINTAHTVASRWAPMDFGQRHARNPPTIR